MKNILFLLIGIVSLSCSQDEASMKGSQPDTRLYAEDRLLYLAGIPDKRADKQKWVSGKTYQDVDKMFQTFLVQNEGKLSKDELEIFNRASSRFILSDMHLIDSKNQPKINQYVTTFFKSGGSDVPLMWKGLNIARKNNYWDGNTEAQAAWFLNLVIDVKEKKYAANIASNSKQIAEKPIYKVLLSADNAKMEESLAEFKEIKSGLAAFPQSKPASKEAFMAPIN